MLLLERWHTDKVRGRLTTGQLPGSRAGPSTFGNVAQIPGSGSSNVIQSGHRLKIKVLRSKTLDLGDKRK